MPDYSNDLAAYDSDFTPQQNQNFKPGLDTVADGVYDWTILSASLDRTAKTNDLILRVELRCEPTSQAVEFAYFMRDQQNADRLGGDLAVLGFPVGTWNARHGKKFSEELPKAVAQMAGLRFKGQKKANPSKTDPQKVYHNLYVQTRLPNADPSSLPAAGAPTHAAAGLDSVPF